MLHKTRGIVFNYLRYRDTSIITKIFTEQFGLQSYIVNGVRSARARGKIALYQPLTLLELVVYKKKDKGINRISEIRCPHPFKTIPYNIVKSSIGIFLSEILYKCVKDDEHVQAMFDFIYHSIEVFDTLNEQYLNFHLQFLVKLSHHLGIGINSTSEFPHIADNEVHRAIENLIRSRYGDTLTLHSNMRRIVLDDLLAFYKLHIDTLGEVKSLSVLKSIFNQS